MTAAPSAQLPPPPVSVDAGLAPPEIIRFRRGNASGDYYQALGAAAQVRLRLLGTLHTRAKLDGDGKGRNASRRRLEAQQTQVWQQLEWLVSEMRRLDEISG